MFLRTTPKDRTKRSPAVLLCTWLTVALLFATAAVAAEPTVNGRFYGDGDNLLYQPYATSAGGSVLYSYLDVPTTTLYVALVVNHAVNDLVCQTKESGPGANAYLHSADAGDPIFWTGHRSCKRASDSEFASFSLECAPNSPNSWSWQQALGCAQVAGPPESSWVSDPTCASSAGTWPPSIDATSSWVANVNSYQTTYGFPPVGAPWDMYVDGASVGDWKTPFVAASPNDVTQVPGYPTYSPLYDWEWSMLYEWSVDLGPGGANCADEAIFFVTGVSHHSPPKSGPENDAFPPPSGDPLMDWGDLPESYATSSTTNGPRHALVITAPYLGTSLQNELDATPTADASGDGAEEDGLTINLTENWDPGTSQTITVEVGNAPSGATLAAWFDWNGDGDFSTDDPGEYFTWSVVEGTNNLTITIPDPAGVDDDFLWASDELNVRLRIFTDETAAPGGSLSSADFEGMAANGEVEDYNFGVGALPVTLNAFESLAGPGGEMIVRWQTATETDNVGFELSGLVNGRWRPVGDFVPSRGMNSALPQSYELRVSPPKGLTALELVDYDTRGWPERFGPFRLGASYGEVQPIRRVDWSRPRADREDRLHSRGFSPVAGPSKVDAGENRRSRWRKLADAGGRRRGSRPGASAAVAFEVGDGETISVQQGPRTHVAVTEPGIQRISYEALRDAGLDLLGVRGREIAVSWRGEPVARWVGGGGGFGPGSAIEFIGLPPQGDDALYLDANLYQISVDPALVREASRLGRGRARQVSADYRRQEMVDRPVMYHRQSPTGDPWVEQSVLVRGGTATVSLEVPVEDPVMSGQNHLILGLGTVTDLPAIIGADGQPVPEHNVEVWFSGPGSGPVHLTTAATSGQKDWEIQAQIPPGMLRPGVNTVELRFETDYFYSLVLIDRYGVSFRGPYVGPELDFGPDPRADGYRIGGFSGPSIVAYAQFDDGSLTRLDPWVRPSGNGYAAELRQVAAARFWVDETPHLPEVFTTEAPNDLLQVPADLVVIADSSFVGSEALEIYLAETSSLDPVVIDVEDIYNSTGFGMAVPSAITDYLRVRDEVQPFSHVQLVGTDCYDRLNRLSDCVSFIPLPTAPIGVTRYSPSQNRLVDLDGDGVGDKAVGQFSVRDEAELDTIVRKGVAWNASRPAGGETALLIAEETDGRHSFDAQIQRLGQRLGWPATEVLNMADHPDIGTARDTLRSSLDSGRALTVFSGHSSPSVWAFRSLLSVADVAELTNFGRPTMMVPLACETTYDVSPDANVLGHQLLYAGDQGAVAISGAVALSSLDDNERMAEFILDGLNSGLTLGEAVQAGREALGTAYQTLQDNWVTQGDVTARIAP